MGSRLKLCPVCRKRARRPGRHTCSDACALVRWRRHKRNLNQRARRMDRWARFEDPFQRSMSDRD